MRAKLLCTAMLLGIAGCSGLLGIDNYRNCRSEECEGGTPLPEAGDGGGDEVPPSKPCTTLDDCGPGWTMCTSRHECRKVRSLSPGMSSHQCAVLDDDEVLCWGTNDRAQLGTNDPGLPRAQPKFVPKLPQALQVTTGLGHTCALTKDGDVWCWGMSDEGGNTGSPVVVNIPRNGEQVKQISSGIQEACALLTDHRIYCWGPQAYGEQGCSMPMPCNDPDGGAAIVPPSGTTKNPRQLATGAEGFTHIAVGLYVTCAMVGLTGQVHCWGESGHIASSGGMCCAQSDIAPVNGGPAQRLVASDFFACRQDDIGRWDCWGDNNSCALAYPNCNVPLMPTFQGIDSQGGPQKIAAGWRQLCWTSGGTNDVKCRGANQWGELGNNSLPDNFSHDTAVVKGLDGLAAIDLVSHRYWACALLEDASVRCWGANDLKWMLGIASNQFPKFVTSAQKVDFGNP